MPRCLLGLDIGGSGAKAGLFSVDTGRLVGAGYVEYRMTSAVPGHAEHDAETWWQAAILAIRQAIDGCDPAAIGADNGHRRRRHARRNPFAGDQRQRLVGRHGVVALLAAFQTDPLGDPLDLLGGDDQRC